MGIPAPATKLVTMKQENANAIFPVIKKQQGVTATVDATHT